MRGRVSESRERRESEKKRTKRQWREENGRDCIREKRRNYI